MVSDKPGAVHTELVTRISRLVDQLVTWLSEGIQVILEVGPVHTDVVPIDPACELVPTRTTVARLLDDLVKPERDPGEGSPLFEDIHAAARLENQINKL